MGVTNRNCFGALFAGIFDRHQGVHGFTGLANGDHQRLGGDYRVFVTELVAELNFYRNTCPLLDGVGANHAGIGGRATGNQNNSVDTGKEVITHLGELWNLHDAVDNPATHGVRHCVGVLGDFFSHKGGPATLIGGRGIPSNFILINGDRCTSEVNHRDALRSDGDNLVVAHSSCTLGVFHERGNVRA